MTFPLVSIVIPCRNEEQAIEQTIRAVFSQDWPPEQLQVLVVDGLSEDQTRETIKVLQQEFNQLELIDNPKQLTPIAMNLGLKSARGDFFWLLGARQKPAANYLKTCYRILRDQQDVGAVGGVTNHVFQTQSGECIARAMMSPFGVGPGNWRTLTEETDVDTVTAPIYRTELLRSLSGFDEELSRNQDDELNYRVSQAGYRIVFTPKTSLKYTPRDSYLDLFRQYYQYGYWKVYVNQKHHTVTTIRQLAPAAFVGFIGLGSLFSILWRPFRYVYGAILFLYAALAAIAALKAGSAKGFKGIFKAFFILHLSYGMGYIEGLWQFILRRKKPSKRHQRLSR